MHHKRKKNHVPNEEDRNKLAIGYRLSAIGYRLILGVLGVLVSVLSFSAVAQSVGDFNKFSTTPGNSSCRFFDGFADNGNGTVTDPRNGRIWRLCPAEQKWDLTLNKCVGSPEYMTWYEAVNQTAKFKEAFWRIPTLNEAISITGNYEDGCKENNSTKKSLSTFVLQYDGTVQAISDKFIQKTNGYGFLPEFWTLSTCQENEAFACVVSGKSGEIQNDIKRSERRFVYLISNGEKDGDLEYFKQAKKFPNYIASGKIEAHKQNAELNKRSQEYLKKIEIERREAADRDEQYRRDAPARQARQMCEAQKQTCVASCPRWVNSGGYRTDLPEHSCQSRCESISCY